MLFSPPVISDPSEAVLIVDDDRMVLEMLAHAFAKFGFKVFRAHNGSEAWNLYNNEKIHLVLTDIQMPEMDGKELSRRIRSCSQHTKIVVMTGGAGDAAMELITDGTADHFFPKPLKISDICSMLPHRPERMQQV